MEQKSYKFEIIDILLEENKHIRSISKHLNKNPMTISRKINELYKQNVVDYKQEGKNKVFFLKGSIEARNYVLMAEFYKLQKVLKKYPVLRRIINGIQANKKIRLAVLFGSYAKLKPREQSDIDIYIETRKREMKKQIEGINSKINVKLGVFDKKDLLIKEIVKNHVIIKGVERFYELTGFFEESQERRKITSS